MPGKPHEMLKPKLLYSTERLPEPEPVGAFPSNDVDRCRRDVDGITVDSQRDVDFQGNQLLS